MGEFDGELVFDSFDGFGGAADGDGVILFFGLEVDGVDGGVEFGGEEGDVSEVAAAVVVAVGDEQDAFVAFEVLEDAIADGTGVSAGDGVVFGGDAFAERVAEGFGESGGEEGHRGAVVSEDGDERLARYGFVADDVGAGDGDEENENDDAARDGHKALDCEPLSAAGVVFADGCPRTSKKPDGEEDADGEERQNPGVLEVASEEVVRLGDEAHKESTPLLIIPFSSLPRAPAFQIPNTPISHLTILHVTSEFDIDDFKERQCQCRDDEDKFEGELFGFGDGGELVV